MYKPYKNVYPGVGGGGGGGGHRIGIRVAIFLESALTQHKVY